MGPGPAARANVNQATHSFGGRMANQQWLGSGKRRENRERGCRDIRDFVVLHGKILKGGAELEEEGESDFQSPAPGTDIVRAKQTHITVYKDSGCGKSSAGRRGRPVAPASKFSKGVRKKVEPTDIDKENSAPPPCTVPVPRERGSRRKRREEVNHTLKNPAKSSRGIQPRKDSDSEESYSMKGKQLTGAGPLRGCAQSPSTHSPSSKERTSNHTHSPSSKERTSNHTHTATTHLPHPHSSCEEEDVKTRREAIGPGTAKSKWPNRVVGKPTGSRDIVCQGPVQGAGGRESWISCRKRKHRGDTPDGSPQLVALSSKHSAVPEELCPVIKQWSEGYTVAPPCTEKGKGIPAEQVCSSGETDSDDIIVGSYDTNELLAELSYYEKL